MSFAIGQSLSQLKKEKPVEKENIINPFYHSYLFSVIIYISS